MCGDWHVLMIEFDEKCKTVHFTKIICLHTQRSEYATPWNMVGDEVAMAILDP